ncbi:pentatricopeptide repeat-containing protein At1g09900-like [Salvia hispanica]|uniref:pentatricopeptide repeat-containing protein At1g09900-like n=1 Tax=Salvia hispanica TaxID=49212 RepID=UPI002008FD77|nr:pentatricopeptide repeat-containing protein At1g09900-like [Salvia hispanica]
MTAAAARRLHHPLSTTLSDPISVIAAVKSQLLSINPQNPQFHQNPNPAMLNQFSHYLTQDFVLEVIKKQPNPYHSLFFFNWASNPVPNPNNYSHSHFCYIAIADKLLTHKLFSLAADLLKSHGKFSDFMVGKFIKAHGDLGHLKSCAALFNQAKSDEFGGCLFSFNSLLGILVKNHRVKQAWGFFANVVIKSSFVIPDVSTYTTMIVGLCKVGNAEYAEKLFDEMPERNSRSYNAIINGLCKNGLVERARRILDKMDEEDEACKPDVIAYSILIDGYCKKGEIENALNCFDEMVDKGKCEPNLLTYNALINGLCVNGDVDEAKRMMSRMRLAGVRDNIVTHTSLLKGYCMAGRTDEAISHFKEMVSLGMSLDLKSYSVVANEYCKIGRPDEAIALLREMKGRGIVPSLTNCNSVLRSLVKLREFDKGVRFLKQMAQWGCRPNFVSYSMVIAGLVGCEGRMEDVDIVVDDMIRDGHCLDATLYSLLIRAKCEGGDVGKAVDLLEEMIGEGLVMKRESFEVFVKEMSERGLVNEVGNVFDRMRSSGLVFDVVSYQNVLDKYVGS